MNNLGIVEHKGNSFFKDMKSFVERNIISKGIAKSRLTGKGYGESQLVNDCGFEPTNK